MVAAIVLIQNVNGDMHDQDGHLRNAAGQKLDYQGAAIHDTDADSAAAQAVDDDVRQKTLANYNRPDQYYNNRSAIHPRAIQRQDFELNLNILHPWYRYLTVDYHTSILWTIWRGSRI